MKRMGTGLALGVAAVALLATGEAWACGGGRPAYSNGGAGYGPATWGPAMPGRMGMPQPGYGYRPMAYNPGTPYAMVPQRPAPVPVMVGNGPHPSMMGGAVPYGYGMPYAYRAPYGYGPTAPMMAAPQPMLPYAQAQPGLVGWPGPAGFGTMPMAGSGAVSRNLPPYAMAVPEGPYGYPFGTPYGQYPWAMPAPGPYYGPGPGWGPSRW